MRRLVKSDGNGWAKYSCSNCRWEFKLNEPFELTDIESNKKEYEAHCNRDFETHRCEEHR